MKTILIISILLGLLSLMLNIKTGSNKVEDQSVFSPVPFNYDTTFLIGALDDGWDLGLTRMDELGFNVWHKYCGVTHGWVDPPWAPDDLVNTDISIYGPQVRKSLETIYSHGLNAIIMRPKISMLCYGERSDYQCEEIPSTDSLWFYSFQSPDHTGSDINDCSEHGAGERVRFMKQNVDESGLVVSRLRANTEQCQTFSFVPEESPIKNWIIKPRIRIDPSFVQNNPDHNVCRIDVRDTADRLIKSVILKGRNFRDNNLNYDGRYLEEFNNLPDSLRIHGQWGKSELGFYAARGNAATDVYTKIDIQVYWYGNCDMWIDYVRVDNLVAHELFKGVYDNTWLDWEARTIACHNESSIKFYMGDQFEFSNIPCMAYVNRKLDSICYETCGRHVTLTSLATGSYAFVAPWNDRFGIMNKDHLIRNYVEKVGLSDIFIACYPFYTNKYGPPEPVPYGTTFCKIPNTLPFTDGPGVLSNPIPPAAYDDWLQDNLDYYPYHYEVSSTDNFPHDGTGKQHRGAFRWTMQLGDAISKAKNIPFLYNGQSHLWYYHDGESHREPTNEELDMLANVPLTYGARGLIYFFYPSWGNNIIGDATYGMGFANPHNQPRIYNAYHQNKWEMTKKLVQRMKKWEPYIMSFDNANRKSYILRIERNNLIDETYFNDVLSYKPDPTDYTIPSSSPESVSQRYLQVGIFNIPDEQDIRYFMIVNRRCSPIDAENPGGVNGRRSVTIKLDSASLQFSGFNNWNIYDLETNTLIKTFNKNVESTIDLGWYIPGEGKLYKIVPE